MLDRAAIADLIFAFFRETLSIVPYKRAVLKGLEIYAQTKLDFVDCVLIGYNHVEGVKIHTFDKKMKKVLKEVNYATTV
jgi:predicted nucleic-acid-binding protein